MKFEIFGDISYERLEGGIGLFRCGSNGGKLMMDVAGVADAAYLVFELEALGVDQFSWELEFHGESNERSMLDKPTLNCRMGFIPGLRIRSFLELKHLDNQTLFIPRTPGRLKSVMAGRAIEPAQVRKLAIKVNPRFEGQAFKLLHWGCAQAEPDCTLDASGKLVDELGQAAFRQWEGKCASVDAMGSALQAERSSAAEVTFPAYLNEFGGIVSEAYEATGFFRLEQLEGKWRLIDPKGNRFFSTGVDCTNPGGYGNIKGLEELYDWLPDPQNQAFAPAWQSRQNGLDSTFFSFHHANLIRAFGDDWYNGWRDITRSRMKRWGFNTVAAWSDNAFAYSAGVPYVTLLKDFPSTYELIFRDFPDVYAAEYRERAERYAQGLEPYREETLLVGYFMTNEPKWGFAGEVNLAKEMFRRPHQYATKLQLLAWLKERYEHQVQALNQAWHSAFASFDDVLSLGYQEVPAEADDDLMAFTVRMIDEFVRVPAQALRRVDPRHINLGMRYAWISTPLLYNGSQYVDVFSINCYQFKPDTEVVGEIRARTGKPVLIGEFHFGAPDVGMIAYGLRTVADQQSRGEAYQYFVEQAAAMDDVIGAHYFQWNDQAVLGRPDGEAFQIGLVDVCHSPYQPFIDGIEAAHRHMPGILDGTRQPKAKPPQEVVAHNY